MIFVLYQLQLTSVDLLKRLLCAAGCDQQYHLNKDQYAFLKTTGSTTAALVHFMHRVTEMLETNDLLDVS